MKLRFQRETILVVALQAQEIDIDLIPFDGIRFSIKNYKDIVNPYSADFSIVISSDTFLDAWYYFVEIIKDKRSEDYENDIRIMKNIYEEVINNNISLIRFIFPK